jgi:hypothetical protein
MIEGIKKIFGLHGEEEVHYGSKGGMWPGSDDPWDDGMTP